MAGDAVERVGQVGRIDRAGFERHVGQEGEGVLGFVPRLERDARQIRAGRIAEVEGADRHPGITVEGGGHRVADRIAGVGRRVRDFVAVERDRHAGLVGRGIENDPSAGHLAVGHVHHLDRERPQVGVAIADLHEIGAQQGDAVVDGIDPVPDRARRFTPMGDDFRHRPLRIAEMLGPGEHVIPRVALAGRLLLVDAEVANAG